MKILYFLLLISSISFSQSKDSINIEKKINEVITLKGKGKFTKAFKEINDFYNEVIKIKKDNSLKGRVVFTKGRIEIDLGEYDNAILSAKQALHFYKKNADKTKIASAYNLMGVAYFHKSNIDSTLYYYNKSFKLKKENNAGAEELAISIYNIAIVYEDSGKLDEAINGYKAAANYLASLKDTKFLPDTYLGIANTYYIKRDFENAQIYSEKALNSALIKYGNKSPDITFFYNSYSSILKQKGNYKEAKEFLEKIKQIRVNTYGKYHEWSCEAYFKLGEMEFLNDNYKEAETILEKAISIGEKVKSYVYTAYAKKQLASLYLKTNTSKNKAIKLVKSAIQTLKSIYGEKHEYITECYLILAKLDTKSRTDYLALVYKSANYSSKKLTNIIAPFQVLQALEYESEVYQKKYLKTGELQFLEKQYSLIDEKLKLINKINKSYSSDNSKIILANTFRNNIEASITVCWNLLKKTDEEKYKKKAFQLSEFHRNSSLLSAVKKNKFKKENISEYFLLLEKKIVEQRNKIDLEIYYEKQENNPSIEVLNRLHTQKGVLTEKLDSLQVQIKESFPNYNEHLKLLKETSISQVQIQLKENQQLISYFIGNQNSYFFNVKKNSYQFEKIENQKKLIFNAIAIRKALINRKNINKIAKNLFNILTKKGAVLQKKNLIFITDDVLNYVPFEILLNTENEYLIKNYNISYIGSLGLFLEQNKQEKKKGVQKNWIGFVPEYQYDFSIKNTFKEIKEISKITNGKYFKGVQSTKNNFTKNVKNAKVLHLAMHTKINDKEPQFNQLLFYDKPLTSSEIQALEINAELLVLSACETGYGKLEKGEGVMNLSRAFTYAGVPSTLMSLWKVPDNETYLIMKLFYTYLNKGESKNKALRLAKNEYLKITDDPILKHPYYWAGFILTGNTEVVDFNFNRNWIYLLITLLFIEVMFIKNRFL